MDRDQVCIAEAQQCKELLIQSHFLPTLTETSSIYLLGWRLEDISKVEKEC